MSEKKKGHIAKDMTKIALMAAVAVLVVAAAALGYLYSQQEGKYSALFSNYTRAEADFQILQSNYNALNSNYTSLASQYAFLQAQFQALGANFTQLQDDYYTVIYENNILNSIVNLQEESPLEQGLTFTVYPDSDYPLVYMLNYAGYLIVQFSSTSSVYFTFNVDSFDYEITYPKTPAQSGQFSVPVLPGANWVYIVNPHPQIPAVVTLTLTYVY